MVVLPAVCFDKLEASVNTHGLGAGRYYRYEGESAIPFDFIGHFETCFGDPFVPPHRFGITSRASDKAVFAINKRKDVYCRSLVRWNEFAAELGIVRGPEHSCDVSAHESSIRQNEPRGPTDVTQLERQSIQR